MRLKTGSTHKEPAYRGMKRRKKQVQLFFKRLKTHADPFHRNMAPEAELTVSMSYSFKKKR